jgi:hypothetical protein
MGETVEKIYCCDRDNNDNALAAAILANGNNCRDDWGSMAAMMGGGMNNWMNNPFATVTYRNETPVLNGTTVFVPIVATITITTPNACKCQAEAQVINERFVVAFQGRTTLPTSVTIDQLGMTQGLIKIVCGKSNCYAINSSLSVSIPAEPAA